MHLLLKGLFLMFSSVFTIVGFLMLAAPAKYPGLYAGFVRETVIRRETTERGKRLAIRMQGLMYIAGGAFFALFIWAVL
jgi:hypothetical protein